MPDPKVKSAGGERSKPYKNVSLCMFLSDLSDLDRVVASLRRAGWPIATRSLVVRAAMRRFHKDLAGMSDDEILQLFIADFRTRGAPPDVPPEPAE